MEVARSTRRRVSDDVTVRCRSGKRMRAFGGVDASLGCILLRLNIDSMALVLSFLEVDESYRFLTWPLNKAYRKTFCESVYLWQQLCIGDPFRCNPGSAPLVMLGNMYTDTFCPARGQYMSFMKCKQYVNKLSSGSVGNLLASESLQESVVGAGSRVVGSGSHITGRTGSLAVVFDKKGLPGKGGGAAEQEKFREGAVVTSGSGMSELTRRLLGIGKHAEMMVGREKNILASNLLNIKTSFEALPWTSPLYVLVNWLKFYGHVEGIVAICLEALPPILEDREVRTNAWNNGIRIPDMIFDFMLAFPCNARINVAAMHNFVFLSRPMGPSEGCLFQSGFMRESLAIGGGGGGGGNEVAAQSGKKAKRRHGVLVIFDAMDRFWDNPNVMSMACWGLVNISLVDRHKAIMLQLGAIEKVLAAIRNHPENQEVAYRALFCLVNFVVPADEGGGGPGGGRQNALHLFHDRSGHGGSGDVPKTLDAQLGGILETTIFCIYKWINNAEIVSRSTLILHNLSITENYERMLLLTPGCLNALRLINDVYQNYGRIKRITECIMHGLYEAMHRDEQLEIEYLSMNKTIQMNERESKRRN
mmetsp:Transcript_21327/g.44408  ORF Transcript_21327/g.44408 Transcript_21327/m.44408 type:complete len:589 (+) Transcript_21327:345-2111(+)